MFDYQRVGGDETIIVFNMTMFRSVLEVPLQTVMPILKLAAKTILRLHLRVSNA